MDSEWRIKPVTELTFSDDFMFGAIMQDAEICAKVIELLLKIKVARLEYPELQKQINPYYTQKGVRLDVYVADSERVFDIEIQTYRIPDIGKRTRYYQAMLDIDSLMKGADYSSLRESYVIFLCTKDPFEKALPVYTFERRCGEDDSVELGDATHVKIFNCSAFDKETDARLKAFMDFVQRNRADDELTREIEKMIATKKFEQTFVNEYMAWSLHDRDMREIGKAEGRREGKAEGRREGKAEGRRETARNLLAMGLSVQDIAKATSLTESEILSLK